MRRPTITTLLILCMTGAARAQDAEPAVQADAAKSASKAADSDKSATRLDALLEALRDMPVEAWQKKRAELVDELAKQRARVEALTAELARFDALAKLCRGEAAVTVPESEPAPKAKADAKAKPTPKSKPETKSKPTPQQPESPSEPPPSSKSTSNAPRATPVAVSGPLYTFERHVAPIVDEHCIACHDTGSAESGLDLSSLTSLLAGGSSGEVVASGNPDSSRLWRLVSHQERPFMPPDEPKIAKEKLAILRRWIELGAPVDEEAARAGAIRIENDAAKAAADARRDGVVESPMPSGLLPPQAATGRAAPLHAIAMSPGAPLLAVGIGGDVHFIDVRKPVSDATTRMGFLHAIEEGRVEALRFSPNGRSLIVAGGRAGKNARAVVIDVASGRVRASASRTRDAWTSADVADDGTFVVAGAESHVRIFDAAGQERSSYAHRDWVHTVRMSCDTSHVASLDRRGQLILFDLANDGAHRTIDVRGGATSSLCLNPRGDEIAVITKDGTLHRYAPDPKIAGALREASSARLHGSSGVAIEAVRDGFVSLAEGGELITLDAALRPKAKGRVPCDRSVCLAVEFGGGRTFVGGLDGTLHDATIGSGKAKAPVVTVLRTSTSASSASGQ